MKKGRTIEKFSIDVTLTNPYRRISREFLDAEHADRELRPSVVLQRVVLNKGGLHETNNNRQH